MKLVYMIMLLLCAVAAGEVFIDEIPNDYQVTNRLGAYSQEFVFRRGNPEYEPSAADAALLQEVNGHGLIDDIIQNALDELRNLIINGNDIIPPLDPLVVPSIGPYDLIVSGVPVKAGIENFRGEGLRWIIIDSVTFNPLQLALGLRFTLPWLIVTGTYDAEVTLSQTLSHSAGGNFRIFVNRLEATLEARLGTKITTGQLVLRSLLINLEVYDVVIQVNGMTGSALINSFINSYIQSLTQDIVQANMANISQKLSEELFDVINDILKDYTLADILG